MFKKIIQTILCMLSLFLLIETKLQAQEKPKDMALFSIELLAAKGQDPSLESYYEFDVSQGLKTRVPIRVLNHQDKAIQIEMTVSQAMTNHYGYIQYNRSFEADNYIDSVQKISDFISVSEEKVTIPARADKILSFDLSVPPNAIEGNLLAGINFKELDEKEEKGIRSTYSYVVALVLKDSMNVLESSDKLEYLSSEIVEINHRPFLQVQFLNPEAKVLDNLSLDIRLKQKGQEVLKHQKEGLQMAPQTKMKYTVPLNELKLDDQEIVAIHAQSHGHSWHFKDEIEPKSNKKTEDKKGKEAVLGFLMLLAITSIYAMKKIVRRNV